MIRPRIVGLIFAKDVVDAIRDSRVLTSLLVPVLLGFAYNAFFQDEQRTKVVVAYHVDGESALVTTLRESVPRSIDLVAEAAPDADAVRARVRGDAHLGIIVPAGFDDAVRAGRAPALIVVAREGGSPGGTAVALTLDGALRAMAGQRAPAAITTERVVSTSGPPPLIQELGLRRYMVLATVIMLIGFVALIAVPIILAEEVERRTLDALTLVARHAEVVLAKALVGGAYVAAGVLLLLAITRIAPADPGPFALGVALVGTALIGFGLLLGSLFRTAGQAYTWSGFFLLPVMMPPFFVANELPPAAQAALGTQATTQGMRLLTNALAGRDIFAGAAVSYGVIAAWIVVGYALLVWRLRSREA